MVGETRRFVLKAEGRDDIPAPSREDIVETAQALCPADGCSFMILEEDRPDAWGDYVQAAGGRDVRTDRSRVTVERRVYARDGNDEPDLRRRHEHLVAGIARRSARPARIATNGFHVVVRANEVLSPQDVIEIMTAFLASRDLPAAYRWRSNREEVGDITRDTKARRQRH